jgi:hypothetical protein
MTMNDTLLIEMNIGLQFSYALSFKIGALIGLLHHIHDQEKDL